MPDVADPAQLVRQSYNRMASAYLAARSKGLPDPPVLAHFSSVLPRSSLVLDAGCGAGVPVTQLLAERHRVVGIDFSIAQARLACSLVPSALIACQDMTQPAFRSAVFDGVCSLYAILHIPRSEHRSLLAAFHRILRGGGLALLCLGVTDTQGEFGPYFGTRMYWSHFDARENLGMLAGAGFSIISSEVGPDPISKIATHLFVLARKEGA